MRFSHWLKTLASAAVLSVSAESAMAQDPGYPGAGQPMFQPAYGTNDPGVLYPQGVPQGFNPYPAISPFGNGNVAWDQTFQDTDGLWYERILNRNREYFASVDVTYNTIKNPGSRELGSPHIPLDPVSGGMQGFFIPNYNQGGSATATTGGTTTTSTTGIPANRVVIDNRVIPYPLGGSLPVFVPVQFNNAIFPIRGMSEFDNYQSVGLEGRIGFVNEDGSGVDFNTFWTGPSSQSFTMGEDSINGVKITKEIIANTDGQLLFMRNGAVPLNWGFVTSATFPGLTGALGTTKYDLLFHMDTKTSVIGAGSNFFLPYTIRRPGLKVRPMVGGRYLNIDDQFNFRGIDSGFDYGFTIVTGGAGGGGGGAGGGTTSATTYRPTPGSLIDLYELVDANLTSRVNTNLAGPQVGLRYDLGEGDGFKMWGQSIAGVMANNEQYHLYGNNIGDQASLLLYGGGLDMLASDARFNSRRSFTHVSPLFEQSVNAEMKILEMIPGIRRLPGVEDTVFKLGYTITVVGGVARAGDSIDWKGFPYFPSIDPGRETWWTSRWNFGIERRF